MASSRFGCNDGFMLAGRMSDRRIRSRARATRLVQVAHDGDAAYARCRDFSDTGMKLDLTAPLEINAYVAVALSPSVVLCGTVAWINGRECGIAFDGPVDSAALLDAAEPAERLSEAATTLDMLGGRQTVTDSSPRGAVRRSGIHFEAGLKVTVMTGPDQEHRGIVRWARGNIAAFEFTVPNGEDQRLPQALLTAPE